MAKSKKERKKQYDPKLAIKGSFEDVLKVSAQNLKKPDPAPKKQGKEEKK